MSLVEYVAACQHYGVHVNDEDRDGNMSTMIWNEWHKTKLEQNWIIPLMHIGVRGESAYSCVELQPHRIINHFS